MRAGPPGVRGHRAGRRSSGPPARRPAGAPIATSTSSRGSRSSTSSSPSRSRTAVAISAAHAFSQAMTRTVVPGSISAAIAMASSSPTRSGISVGKPSSSSAPSGDSGVVEDDAALVVLVDEEDVEHSDGPAVDGSGDGVPDAALLQVSAEPDDGQVNWPDRPFRHGGHGTPSDVGDDVEAKPSALIVGRDAPARHHPRRVTASCVAGGGSSARGVGRRALLSGTGRDPQHTARVGALRTALQCSASSAFHPQRSVS